MSGCGQSLRARVDAGLQSEREAVTERVDLCDDGLRRVERTAAPAHDLQDGAENFVFHVVQTLDLEGGWYNAVNHFCY